jgi:hypothetical protein
VDIWVLIIFVGLSGVPDVELQEFADHESCLNAGDVIKFMLEDDARAVCVPKELG